jgi:hypothetical protein
VRKYVFKFHLARELSIKGVWMAEVSSLFKRVEEAFDKLDLRMLFGKS